MGAAEKFGIGPPQSRGLLHGEILSAVRGAYEGKVAFGPKKGAAKVLCSWKGSDVKP